MLLAARKSVRNVVDVERQESRRAVNEAIALNSHFYILGGCVEAAC